ncbi:ATP-dependent zinc protease family protein [Botrimarina hoheduenensis]|uniref:Retropepsin-like aspartic endopeptidase domain-containing protein n=1 Tax=Botrimarina hoheduenensis TaxID=2528000 RepID=A0A5C5WBS2_9BACT|nr:ATP-dependent zinc protease [Botrimarina hoheduenensis]TWT48356.1 hypothetical protein Pla111_01190 [Botrimarina hoheduenensis]
MSSARPSSDKDNTDPPASCLTVLGWREWIALPGLSIPRLRAKIDTGAKTSSLHAEACEEFEQDGAEWVRFVVRTPHHCYRCTSEVIDRRMVKSSNGQTEDRPVIRVEGQLGSVRWHLDLTLTDRTPMRFPMLLGRRAMDHRFVIDPARSYAQPKPPRRSRKPSA